MKRDEVEALRNGLYKVYWNNEKESFAAVGRDNQGKVWLAPTDGQIPSINLWSQVAHVAPVEGCLGPTLTHWSECVARHEFFFPVVGMCVYGIVKGSALQPDDYRVDSVTSRDGALVAHDEMGRALEIDSLVLIDYGTVGGLWYLLRNACEACFRSITPQLMPGLVILEEDDGHETSSRDFEGSCDGEALVKALLFVWEMPRACG
jgi:hypothetical protein